MIDHVLEVAANPVVCVWFFNNPITQTGSPITGLLVRDFALGMFLGPATTIQTGPKTIEAHYLMPNSGNVPNWRLQPPIGNMTPAYSSVEEGNLL